MEMCYNDCKLNRTESKPKTRCQICQILVHNICLDEPKKTISSGAWTCRDCRKNPLNTQILLDLVTGLCDKIASLEPIILSLQKQKILTSNSTQTDSLSDRAHMCTQTEDESPPVDVFEDITASSLNDTGIINPPHEQDVSMIAENTSATVSYLHAMLDGIEQNKDNDIPLSNPICSATTPVVKIEPDRIIFNHVFIGNVLPDTTVEEVRLFLLNIGLTEVTSVEHIGRYKSHHTSFHVTIPVHQNIDLVYNYEWRDGIIVEPFRMSTRHSNYHRRHRRAPHTVYRKSTYVSHQQRSSNFRGSHTEIYQSHPQASLHRSSSPRHHHDQHRNRRTPVVAPRHRRSRASALHHQHGSSTVNTLNSHEPHQRPKSHVAHPIRYDRVRSQVYTNSDPRLTCPITPVGQSHPVPTGASTPHSVHSYNDTHRYNNA